MTHKALIIPGLFTTPASRKAKALENVLSHSSVEIVDFSKLYKGHFSYQDHVDIVEFYLKESKPDFLITYSLGFQLYQNVISRNEELEVKASAVIVPVGNYMHSENGTKILYDGVLPSDIYKPINELKITPYISKNFFIDMATDGLCAKYTQFKEQMLVISASQDKDVDPDQFNHAKTQGVARRMLLYDDHRMMNSMGSVCDMVHGFSLNYQ
jgi:hypothetical protein